MHFEGLRQALVASSGVGELPRYFERENALLDGRLGGLEGGHARHAVGLVQLRVNLEPG